MSRPQDLPFNKLEELLRKAQRGDQEAYGEFLKELYPLIKYKVRQRLGDLIDCDDITQECLIGIHKSLETYDPDKDLKPWILGILRHKMTDFFRQWGRRSEVDVEKIDFPVTFSDAATNTEAEEGSRDQVMSLVNKLPEPQKRALILTKVSGLSCKKASLEEGISEAAFRKRVSRAYKLLRDVCRVDVEKNFGD